MIIKLYRTPSEFADVGPHITIEEPGNPIHYSDYYELPEGYTEGETKWGERAIFDPEGKYCELNPAGTKSSAVLLTSAHGVKTMRIVTDPVENRLRERRQYAGLTQQQLASAVGVQQKQISAWETGQNEPSIKVLKAMAHALGCTVDDLI